MRLCQAAFETEGLAETGIGGDRQGQVTQLAGGDKPKQWPAETGGGRMLGLASRVNPEGSRQSGRKASTWREVELPGGTAWAVRQARRAKQTLMLKDR